METAIRLRECRIRRFLVSHVKSQLHRRQDWVVGQERVREPKKVRRRVCRLVAGQVACYPHRLKPVWQA